MVRKIECDICGQEDKWEYPENTIERALSDEYYYYLSRTLYNMNNKENMADIDVCLECKEKLRDVLKNKHQENIKFWNTNLKELIK